MLKKNISCLFFLFGLYFYDVKNEEKEVLFIKEISKDKGSSKKQEKNVTQKVIDLAKEITDSIADTVIDLVSVGKSLSDITFKRLEEGNKKELNRLYKNLQECKKSLEVCQKEVLEIEAKISTLT